MTDWQAIQSEYQQGASLRSLAARHGVGKSTIERHAKMGQWDSQAGQRDAVQVESNAHPTPEKDLSTKDKQRLFLEAYAKHANVMVSARQAGIHRSTVYEWLEKDDDFSFAYHQAKEDAKDVLRAEIFRRAHDGWEEPVYQLGYLAGSVRKYDTTLLIFHAKMLMPEYRDKSTVDVNATVNSADALAQELRALSNDQFAQFKQWVAEAKGKQS